MIQLGLIGYPLEYSLSPKIHTAALNACGLDGNYSLFSIQPDDKPGLKGLLECVRSGEMTGLNVTIPHKQNVIPLLDELSPTAKAIGAVNTIYRRENNVVGDNTDVSGFLSDLQRFLAKNNWSIVHRPSSLVLGSGGSARAVVYALLRDDWKVAIAARRVEQAEQLSLSFPNHELLIMDFGAFDLSAFQLIVNTTPMGMSPNTNQSPLPENTSLSNGTMIYDLVYNPRETKLVRDARRQGLQATTGLGMLIEQAALAFELWTGHNPPRDVLWNAAEN